MPNQEAQNKDPKNLETLIARLNEKITQLNEQVSAMQASRTRLRWFLGIALAVTTGIASNFLTMSFQEVLIKCEIIGMDVIHRVEQLITSHAEGTTRENQELRRAVTELTKEVGDVRQALCRALTRVDEVLRAYKQLHILYFRLQEESDNNIEPILYGQPPKNQGTTDF